MRDLLDLLLSYLFINLFIVVIVNLAKAGGAVVKLVRDTLFPQCCQHGVPLRKSCGECVQIRAEVAEEQRRRLEEERQRLEEQRWHKRIEETQRLRELDYLKQMDPYEFERFICHMYRELGWEVQETPASGDGGVDGYLRRDGELFILQCKRFSSGRVGSPDLRLLQGAILAKEADGGIFVTTSSFTEEARKEAERSPKLIELVNGHELLSFIARAYPEGSLVPEEFISTRRSPSAAPTQCPSCGARTRRVKGKYGPFFGCTAFPHCRWTMPARR